MPIAFNGIDLLLEDPQAGVRRWLDEHLPELHASIFCPMNTAIVESRYIGITNQQSTLAFSSSSSSGFPLADTPTIRRVGLPVGNYPRPPKPRINSLYWPSGSTRWANGLFLIDDSNLTTIISALVGEQSGLFQMSCPPTVPQYKAISSSSGSPTPITNGLSATMWMLQPRPVSAPGVTASKRLWLLPLVCSRYWWQYYHVNQYAPASWLAALNAIQGVSTNDTPNMGDAVSCFYGRPSATEFVRDFENAALLTDAIALSLQRRVAGGITSNASYRFSAYELQTPRSADAIVTANLGQGWQITAGGFFSNRSTSLGNVPDKMLITFGNREGDRVGGFVDYSISSASAIQTNGGSKVFHCSYPTSQTPSRVGSLAGAMENGLGNQAGADYFAWITKHHYDLTYAGIVPWQPSGYDDYVRWEISVHGRGKNRKYECQTRAVSMPTNFGFESLPIDLLPCLSSSSSQISSSKSSSSPSPSPSSPPPSSSSRPPSSSPPPSSHPSSSSTNPCSGSCPWLWGYFLNFGPLWNDNGQTCNPSFLTCQCPYPSFSGTTIGQTTNTGSCVPKTPGSAMWVVVGPQPDSSDSSSSISSSSGSGLFWYKVQGDDCAPYPTIPADNIGDQTTTYCSSSSSSGSLGPCCNLDLPSTLTLTISGCYSAVVPLTLGMGSTWSGTNGPDLFNMYCDSADGTFKISVNCTWSGLSMPMTGTCSPFDMTVSGTLSGCPSGTCGAGGSVTFEVTA